MCHVLIIEDERLIAEHIRDLVEQAGASTVDVVATEAEAVDAARRQTPAIILSDVRLAEGTGPNAVEQIRHELGPIPTIFITETPDECRPCEHAAAILAKPIIDDVIIKSFRRFAPL